MPSKWENILNKNKIVILIVVIVLILLLLIGSGFLIKKINENQEPEQEFFEEIQNILTDETVQKQGDLLFRNISINSSGATNKITGIVKNEGTKTLSFTLEMKMYELRNNRMLGISDAKITDLGAGNEREFEINIIGDYTTVDKFMVETKDVVEQ